MTGSNVNQPDNQSALEGTTAMGRIRHIGRGAGGDAGGAGGAGLGSGEGRGESGMITAVQVVACGQHQRFTEAETRELAALPEALEDLEPDTWCELETDHPGPHFGFGQISRGAWWWLRWTETADQADPDGVAGGGGQRALVDAGFCGTQPAQGRGDCTLPAGHPGRHSFELGAGD